MLLPDDPAYIDTTLDCRAISFENPRGERGQGGTTGNGRKGSPLRVVTPGEKIVLANIAGPHSTFLVHVPARAAGRHARGVDGSFLRRPR